GNSDSPSRRNSTGRLSTRYTSRTWFSRSAGIASLSADGVAGQSRIARVYARDTPCISTCILSNVGWALASCCVLTVLMGEPKEAQLGQSLEGRPILSYTLGDGPPALLVIGGIHGAPEINSSALVWQLLTYFADEPDAVPEGVSLVFVP